MEDFSIRKTPTDMAVFLKEKPFSEGKSAPVDRTGADPQKKCTVKQIIKEGEKNEILYRK